MTEHDFEDRLRADYRELAEEDARAAPSFEAVLQAARGRPARVGAVSARAQRWAWGGAAAATLAAAAALVLMLSAPDPEDRFEKLVAEYAAAPGGPAWRAPTDALLRVPGRDLLTTVPTIGESITRRPAPSTGEIEDDG